PDHGYEGDLGSRVSGRVRRCDPRALSGPLFQGQRTSTPPHTLSACPLTYAAASETRYATAPATSSGRPSRPSGTSLVGEVGARGSVAISRGQTALHVIPSGPSSSASVGVSPSIACFPAT